MKMVDRHENDATYFRMFDKWPCNTFKPRNHIVAKHDEMHVLGKDVCEGYKGIVKPRKNHGEWIVTLSDGATWAYRTLSEMLIDWRIARTWDEYRNW